MITTMRADELIPGDMFDTTIGTGHDRFAEIVSVRVVENNSPNTHDRIEIRYKGTEISPTRTMLADREVRVWIG